jgi:uncharacterized RmlC-like cupin family protein
MSIPATVLICHRTYAITVQPMLSSSVGACDPAGQSITIEADAHAETQASVLLHEVIEAINASMGLRLKHHTIDALETALYAVLVSNPAWWVEK